MTFRLGVVRHSRRIWYMFFGLVFTAVAQLMPTPTLDGRHFKVTVVEEKGFVDIDESGEVSGGYCIDVFASIAKQANFTYEFRPPSGMGNLCTHHYDNSSDGGNDKNISTYARGYQAQYLCGQSDVNDAALTDSEYATDMYLSLFYVTPERQLQNEFSMSFHPPTTGALTFFGIATKISNVEDLIRQQKKGKQRPVCLKKNTAFSQYIRESFPLLQTKPFDPGITSTGFYETFTSGECDIQISDNPIATQFILNQKRRNQCDARGKPVGIITAPLTFGFSQYAIGIRKDMPRDIIDTINYWMNVLMTCSPSEPQCDSFAQYYPDAGGTGDECGYSAFPPPERLMSPGAIGGLVVGITAMIICVLVLLLQYRLCKQRKRYKKRFVQQIARNITIGPSPRHIPADKLADEIKHIAGKNGVIAKDDLRDWMFDIKLNFISDKDFDALWHAIDVDRRGTVEPVEFIVFLSLCGPEFEKVYQQMESMPKTERLKFATRRLTNYREQGEKGVRKMEHDFDRRARQNVALKSSSSSRLEDDSDTRAVEYSKAPEPISRWLQKDGNSSRSSAASNSSSNCSIQPVSLLEASLSPVDESEWHQSTRSTKSEATCSA